MPIPPPRLASLASLAVLAALALGGCGSAPGERPAAAPPPERTARALEGSPPPLARLHAQSNRLLGGGPTAFKRRLVELRGYPVVVNKWASWCGPCRAEFPFFGSQAKGRFGEVAFLGVNSEDNEADAAGFLTRFPVGYPSYSDPDSEVAQVFNGVTAFPTTAFYDSDGELVYVKQGGYATEELLAQDIDRYALSSAPR